jgi:hypothetical protein
MAIARPWTRTRRDVELPIGDAVRIDYDTEFSGAPRVHQTQYYVIVDEDRALITTFSRVAGDEYAELDEEFAQIMETMEVLP